MRFTMRKHAFHIYEQQARVQDSLSSAHPFCCLQRNGTQKPLVSLSEITVPVELVSVFAQHVGDDCDTEVRFSLEELLE